MPYIPVIVFESSKNIVHVRQRDEGLAFSVIGEDIYTILSYIESYKLIQSPH
jgi:hypothetical protein